MANKSEEKIDEMKQKKEQLEAELSRIQDELDNSIDEVRSDVSHKLKPSEIIREHPLPLVGLSILVGFLAGHKRGSTASGRHSSGSGESREGFSAILLSEFKKLATRKAISAATDYLDQFLERKKEEHLPSRNGTAESE